MTNNVLFDEGGVYVPQVCERVTLWRRDQTGNPLFGVEVGSIHNARLFADVYVISDGQLVDFLPQLKKEIG